jgi:uncharacterized protein YjbI with pentapeptide repeats
MDEPGVREARRQLADHELAAILAAHEQWVDSEGKQGTQADLSHCILRGRHLCGVRLERADLCDSDVTGTDLSGADLHGTGFSGAILLGTSLRDADLRDADLAGAVDLLATQLAGADLTRARLPNAVGSFEGVKQADRIADNAQKLYVALLGACAYSVLTIATTTDAKLITNTATSPLPVIQTAVPIAGFYWVAPLLVVGVYLYFHLYLQRLWEALADLPAVFPDGVSVDRKVDPWLLTGLIRRHVRRLASEHPAYAWLHTTIAVISAWWVVPVTLLLFWGRYLRRHDWVGTALHVILLAASVVAAFLLYRVAVATLRRSGRSESLRRPTRWASAIAVVGVVAGAISLGAIEGALDPRVTMFRPSSWMACVRKREWVPCGMRLTFGYSPFADLTDAEVSVKPPGWVDKKEQIELVTSAPLHRADLRGARALRVFLIKADLTQTRLEGADLRGARLEAADLRGARLEGADLTGARLERTRLRGARLEGASLIAAWLERADLRGTRLERADLTAARLEGADLRGARLEGAILIYARLEGADLSEAFCVSQEQVDSAVRDEKTKLPPSLPSRCPALLPPE